MAGKSRDQKAVREVKALLSDLASQAGAEVRFELGDPHYSYYVKLHGKERRRPFTKNASTGKGKLACIRREFMALIREMELDI